MNRIVHLRCGTLEITGNQNGIKNLDTLIDFATRANPKRGFLFVSKVLGKHIPCTPSSMRSVYQDLARQIDEEGSTMSQSKNLSQIVIGMAETATGLGAGVADSLARRQTMAQIISQQTTRHLLKTETLITFDEIHSHAPDQLLYPPQEHLVEPYFNVDRIILVDDEITSGRTLTELAKALSDRILKAEERRRSSLREMVFVSIVSWLTEAQKKKLQDQVSCHLRFVSLFEGSFVFTPDPGFKPTLPGHVQGKIAPYEPREDLGRRGIDMTRRIKRKQRLDFDRSVLDPTRPISVIGTGEHAYHSFLLAEFLEYKGFDVTYQSTTRSPILRGDAISETLEINDEHGEGVSNYLHNPPSLDRQVIIAYESTLCARQHLLRERLISRGHKSPSIHTWITPSEKA